MLTEEEARKKWCPFARFVIDAQGYGAGNRWDGGDQSATGSMAEKACRCIGSACMSWHWARGEITICYEIHPGPGWKEIGRLSNGGFVFERGEEAAPAGYCGLAGKP